MSGRITFRCPACEKVHEGLPAIVFDAPAHYYALEENEREARAVLTSDTCIIDGNAHYVRAVLKIGIIGETEGLEWGVWGSLSEKNFQRYNASFHGLDQSKLGPLFSWFASRLPSYSFAESLACNLVPQDDRQRPLVEFDPDDAHPLALDKRSGISLERAIEFVTPVLHKH